MTDWIWRWEHKWFHFFIITICCFLLLFERRDAFCSPCPEAAVQYPFYRATFGLSASQPTTSKSTVLYWSASTGIVCPQNMPLDGVCELDGHCSAVQQSIRWTKQSIPGRDPMIGVCLKGELEFSTVRWLRRHILFPPLILEIITATSHSDELPASLTYTHTLSLPPMLAPKSPALLSSRPFLQKSPTYFEVPRRWCTSISGDQGLFFPPHNQQQCQVTLCFLHSRRVCLVAVALQGGRLQVHIIGSTYIQSTLEKIFK